MLLHLALPSAVYARPGDPPTSAPVAVERAAAIDARKAQMEVLERPVDGYSPEGTRVTAYLSRGRIEKIEVVALGERGRVLLDFYWRGSSLSAARERRIDYGQLITSVPIDQPLPMALVQDDTVEFSKQGVSRWFRDGRLQAPKGRALAQRARELAAQARSFRRLMSSRVPAGSPGCQWQCADDWAVECRSFSCR